MKAVIVIVVGLLISSALVWAGPCLPCLDPLGGGSILGFRDERNVSLTSGRSADPDNAVGNGRSIPGEPPILVVWSDDTEDPPAVNPERDSEIWLAVSADGGCGIATLETPCTPCRADCPAAPGPIAKLLEVKASDDVGLSWEPDALAVSGYNLWYVSAETDIPRADMANRTPAGPASPVPGCAAPAPALSESRTHAGAVSDPAPLLHYQVKGYCVGEEGP